MRNGIKSLYCTSNPNNQHRRFIILIAWTTEISLWKKSVNQIYYTRVCYSAICCYRNYFFVRMSYFFCNITAVFEIVICFLLYKKNVSTCCANVLDFLLAVSATRLPRAFWMFENTHTSKVKKTCILNQ